MTYLRSKILLPVSATGNQNGRSVPAMLYCQAILPRAGLGNRLYPWARCRVFSHTNDAPMLSPIWAQLKIGPLLRRETDLRLYLDLFGPNERDVRGVKRMWLRWFSLKEYENEPVIAVDGKNIIKVFEGEQERFSRLNGWERFLLDELRAITRKKWRDAADKVNDIPVGMHVRMGDFVTPKSVDELYERCHMRIPLAWYADSLKVLRETLGYSVKAVIVSDGRKEELAELLQLENVSLLQTGSAVSDLLALAKSKVLIGSASSSFTAWAAFLGQMPSIAHPSQSFDWFNLESRNYYVGGFDSKKPVASFLAQVKSILG